MTAAILTRRGSRIVIGASTAFVLAVAIAVGSYLWIFRPSPLNDATFQFNRPGPGSVPQVAGDPVFIERVVAGPRTDTDGHHAAALTTLADGTLLAAWYRFDGPHELDGARIVMSRRLPGASGAWSKPRPHPRGGGTRANPALYSEGKRVWLFNAVVPWGWSTSRIEFQVSDDGGMTWSVPRRLRGPLGANVRHSPVRVADGALLLPAYDDLLKRSLFYRSTDDETWSLASILTGPVAKSRLIQPTISVLDGGRLLSIMRCGPTRRHWVSVSDDHGRSWSEPADAGLPCPAAPAVLLRLSSGYLLLIYNNDARSRSRLTAALSADDGRHWPIRRVVARGPNVSYPALSQTPDGRIQLLYSKNKRSIQHVEFNEAWIAAGAIGTGTTGGYR